MRSIEADAEGTAIDEERVGTVTQTDVVVRPKGILEEGFEDIDALHAVGVDGVHQVAVVHHHTGWLLGEFLARMVDEVQQARIGEVLDVIHHRGPRSIYFVSQSADIRSRGTVYGQEVEQFLQLRQILQLHLLDEEDVHLYHHIHGLQQVLREIAFLEEEGVETMMQITLEIIQRINLLQDSLRDAFVVPHNLIQGISREVLVCLHVQELAEREATQVVALHQPVQLWILFLQAHHGTAREDDSKSRILIVASAKLCTPLGLLEDLIYQQHLATTKPELTGKVSKTAPLKIKIVHVDVQALSATYIKILLGILKQETRLAHATSALDTDEGSSPVYLVHKGTAHGQIRVLHQVCMCSKKCFQKRSC